MISQLEKTKRNSNQSDVNPVSKIQKNNPASFEFVDSRPQAVAQRKLFEIANNHSRASNASQLQAMTENYTSQKEGNIAKGIPIQLARKERAGRREKKKNKHDRKDKRLEKNSYGLGLNAEEYDNGMPEPVRSAVTADESSLKKDAESDNENGEEFKDSLLHEESSPKKEAKKILSKKEVAEEFSSSMLKEGLEVYLSGGGAIAYQGGSRPISDLDFRISSGKAGFDSFSTSKGQAVLTYINQIVLPFSRNNHKDCMGTVDQFHAIGQGNVLTIGTDNWFKVEVSLSVVPRDQAVVKLAGNKDIPSISVLTLSELLADKLKTMITRTKKGEESVKKVSQDLYDFIDVITLINNSGQEENRSVEEHMEQAILDRMGEYIVANLEGINLHHLSEIDLKELMKARAVLTAQAHIKNGARKQAFEELVAKHSTQINHKINHKNQRKKLLREMNNSVLKPTSKTKLRPWMSAWNDSPFFGPPKKGKPSRAGLNLSTKKDKESVEHLESIMPENFHETILSDLSPHAKSIMNLLHLSGGFRALDNSKSHLQTLTAFGLTANQFSKAYIELKKEKLVVGEADGLHLTAEGLQKLKKE